jgi:hypothetical protein
MRMSTTIQQPEHDDQQLVLLCTRLSRLHFYTNVGHLPDQEMDDLNEHYCEMAAQIADMQPTSIRGAKAKAGVAVQVFGRFITEGSDTFEKLAYAALVDAAEQLGMPMP